MKSQLNSHGVYINNTITEISKDDQHKIIIKVANCDDGYRCAVGFRGGTYGSQRSITANGKAYPTEREAITSEIKSEICAKPEQSPSKEYYFRVYRWMAKQGFLKGGNDENKLY